MYFSLALQNILNQKSKDFPVDVTAAQLQSQTFNGIKFVLFIYLSIPLNYIFCLYCVFNNVIDVLDRKDYDLLLTESVYISPVRS